jgi:hypothetical protein
MMAVVTDVNLALQLLNYLLQLIGEIKGVGGLTDDQVQQAALKVCQGNDQAYQTLMAALAPAQPAQPATPATPAVPEAQVTEPPAAT